jgi:hypothetical protein
MCIIFRIQPPCHGETDAKPCQRQRREGYLPQNCDDYHVEEVKKGQMCSECRLQGERVHLRSEEERRERARKEDECARKSEESKDYEEGITAGVREENGDKDGHEI